MMIVAPQFMQPAWADTSCISMHQPISNVYSLLTQEPRHHHPNSHHHCILANFLSNLRDSRSHAELIVDSCRTSQFAHLPSPLGLFLLSVCSRMLPDPRGSSETGQSGLRPIIYNVFSHIHTCLTCLTCLTCYILKCTLYSLIEPASQASQASQVPQGPTKGGLRLQLLACHATTSPKCTPSSQELATGALLGSPGL